MPTCTSCKEYLSRDSFSKVQLKKNTGRRCKTCVAAASAAAEQSRGNVDDESQSGVGASIPLPDNCGISIQGKATLFKDERTWFGGRTYHVGTASLPPGEDFSLDPRIPNYQQHGDRQKRAVKAMKKAFLEKSVDVLSKTPLDEAALLLDVAYTIENKLKEFQRNGKVTPQQHNENVLMATQRWHVSALPIATVNKVIRIALMYRNAAANYEVPLVAKPMPAAAAVFHRILPEATDQDRPDIATLFGLLIEAPENSNVWVYSEIDQDIVSAWHGLDMEHIQDNGLQEVLLSNAENVTPSAILDYLKSSEAAMLDNSSCYWCGKMSLCCKMSICRKCRCVNYCSTECQHNDWSFHKTECRAISRGQADRNLMVGMGRLDYLSLNGAQRPTIPSPIAPPDDVSSPWRGDMILMYTAEMSPSMMLDENTKVFPRGIFFRAREVSQTT